MTILVFGKTGQVSTELQKYGNVVALARSDADLCRPDACAAIIRAQAPRAVINAAAYTAVDRAEDEEDIAQIVNATTPAAMARACADLDIPFIHISTDHVFPGTGAKAAAPEDPTGPLNIYGRTKLLGENGIRVAGGRFAILRTSWVFSTYGSNFVKTILYLSKTRDVLQVVDDQIGGPTPASAIAKACLKMAEQLAVNEAISGTYHFSGTPDVSWYEFASEILSRTAGAPALQPIPTRAYPTAAIRPHNSRLDCTRTEAAFGLTRPDWRTELDGVIDELESTK